MRELLSRIGLSPYWLIVGALVIATFISELRKRKANQGNSTIAEPKKVTWRTVVLAILIALAFVLGNYLWSRYGARSRPQNQPDPVLYGK
jgi:hypothetical protein